LVLLVLWEQDHLTVSQIGEHLNLDSGTLTPLLKRLEQKNIISRRRSSEDERIVNITLTEEGLKLKEKAASVPQKLSSSMNVSKEELIELKRIIENLLLNIK
jgi:DNA-binding MarR family transcriptional regulator